MTTPPITSITDELIAELDLCVRADCGIELESADIRALLAERADLKQQLVAAGITADNCEMFRKDAERYQWLRGRVGVLNDGYSTVWIPSARTEIDCHDESETDAAIDAAMRQ